MRKWLWSLLAFVLLISLAGGVSAQDVPPGIYCQNLSEADCALLIDSNAMMRELTSAAVQMDIDGSISGIPDVPGVFSLRVSGSGAFTLTDPSVLTTLTDAALTDLAYSDPQTYLQQMLPLLRSFSGDLSFTVFLSPEIRTAAAQDGTELPEKFGFSARMVDGIGYLNLSKLAALDPSEDIPTGWIGIDMVEAVSMAIQEVAMSPMNPAGSGLSSADQMALAQRYATNERLEDTILQGEPAAVFRLTFDVLGLLADPDFSKLMEAQMQAQGMTLSKTEMQQAMFFARMLIQNLQLEATQSIGLESKHLLQTTTRIEWPINIGALMGAMGSSSGTEPPFEFRMQAQIDLSQFNAVSPIEAPEDAQIADLETLLD